MMASILEVLLRRREKLISDITTNGTQVRIIAKRGVENKFFVYVRVLHTGAAFFFIHDFPHNEDFQTTMHSIYFKVKNYLMQYNMQELEEYREGGRIVS